MDETPDCPDVVFDLFQERKRVVLHCNGKWRLELATCDYLCHDDAPLPRASYRRLRARLSAPKAITATAHKIARMFYRLWTTRQADCDPGMDDYEQ